MDNHQPSQELQPMRANRQVIETTCLHCGQGFKLAEPIYGCPSCRGFHHQSCWERQPRCPALMATAGTAEGVGETAPLAEVSPAADGLAQPRPVEQGFNTGLPPDERPCPKCAQIIKREALKCRFCGEVLEARLIQNDAPAANVPGLHWVIVLLLSFITLQLFHFIWAIRQGVWAKKADSSSHALLFYILSVVLLIGFSVLSEIPEFAGIGAILRLGMIVMYQAGNFSTRGVIESRFHRSLSGGMTFFFGPIYHQYKFNEIARGQTENLSILN